MRKDNGRCYGMYTHFIKEIDEMWMPLAFENLDIRRIIDHGELVGFIGSYEGYIDSLYIIRAFRRKGIARRAVKEWYAENKDKWSQITLHTINSNAPAIAFWHSVFELKKVEENPVNTLWQVVKMRDEV